MNPDVYAPEFWTTNPVWCCQRLIDGWFAGAAWADAPVRLARLLAGLRAQGITLPAHVRRDWAALGLVAGPLAEEPPAAPGVVGLLVDDARRSALVTPLRADPAGTWDVAPHLPFAGRLPELLPRLVAALGLPHAGAIPERLAFSVSDGLGQRFRGESMDVAALLALLRGLNPGHPLVRAATSVVQPGPAGTLTGVDATAEKLAAFRREYGPVGSLLVRPVVCPDADPYGPDFGCVWAVGSWADLAREAERAGLLGPVLARVPLGGAGMAVALDRLRHLKADQHRYADALGLADRLAAAPRGPDVARSRLRLVEQARVELNRHLGRYAESLRLARAFTEAVSGDDWTCHEEVLQARLEEAAGLYDAHQFEDMVTILEGCRAQYLADRRLVTPELQARVNNTLARALVALGRPGWEDLYRESLAILAERDPADRPRTLSYLIHGLLRAGRLAEADAALTEAEGVPGSGSFSRWMLAFYRADHRRRAGVVGDSAEMEADLVAGRLAYPFGLYLQATARQAGRPPADRADRFSRAAECFRTDADGADDSCILHFLAAVARLGAACAAGDDAARDGALARLRGFLADGPVADFHAGQPLPPAGGVLGPALEAFLERVVYF